MDQPCPLASNMEVLVYLRNKCYRENKHLPCNQFKTLFEKTVQDTGLNVTEEEGKVLHRLYSKFGRNQTRGKSLGSNNNQFCIYCYGTGHASRDCLKFCPYCLNEGHHWSECNHPTHAEKVRKRLECVQHTSQAFLVAFDKYENQCMHFCVDFETLEDQY